MKYLGQVAFTEQLQRRLRFVRRTAGEPVGYDRWLIDRKQLGHGNRQITEKPLALRVGVVSPPPPRKLVCVDPESSRERGIAIKSFARDQIICFGYQAAALQPPKVP